jgi:NAD(P)-dependent dehydrogenase (short-subunit alcohol dehydrogenase family)
MTIEGRLTGRTALVTGASRGLGAAIAVGLAREGAHPILIARTVGGLEETDDAIRAIGGSATLLPLDLTEFDKIDHTAAAIFERFGGLDILVGNAAGLGMLGPMGHISPAKWQKTLDLNLTANWRLIRAFDPLLRRSEAGRALFPTCAHGHDPVAYWNIYAISKAGLEMMVKVWEAELKLTKIKVALIDPGIMATRLRMEAFPGEDPATQPSPEAAARRFVEAAL